MDGIDRYSGTESESSIPEVLTRDQIREFDDGNLLHSRNEPEQLSVNQRFSEMNRQITELRNLVLILTEKISSSNREGNDLNTVSVGHETRSDTVRLSFNFFSTKGSLLQFFWSFSTVWMLKNPKGSPFQFLRHYETFFKTFLHKRVPSSPIL